jgi:hypothetical protein
MLMFAISVILAFWRYLHLKNEKRERATETRLERVVQQMTNETRSASSNPNYTTIDVPVFGGHRDGEMITMCKETNGRIFTYDFEIGVNYKIAHFPGSEPPMRLVPKDIHENMKLG